MHYKRVLCFDRIEEFCVTYAGHSRSMHVLNYLYPSDFIDADRNQLRNHKNSIVDDRSDKSGTDNLLQNAG